MQCVLLVFSCVWRGVLTVLAVSAAGARQIATGLNLARQTGGRVFVTSMCIGSGMGMAALFVSEH